MISSPSSTQSTTMPARTRTSNQDTSFKVYYSKRVPKQRHFPERRKIVRRKPSTRQEEREYRQKTIVPGRHRTASAVLDSEDEEELVEGAGQRRSQRNDQQRQSSNSVPRQRRTGASMQGMKRKRNFIKEEISEGDEEPIQPTPKRRRNTPKIKQEPSAAVDEGLLSDAEEENGLQAALSASDAEEEETEMIRRRRQSTMTQIVGGRRPRRGDREPEFKPIKRAPRKSWSGGSVTTDVHQRTLTQMVPGLVPLGLMSDEDEEEDEEHLESEPESDSQSYNDAIVAHLSRHGVFSPDGNDRNKTRTSVNGGDLEVEDDESFVLTRNSQKMSSKLNRSSKQTTREENIKASPDVPRVAMGISTRARFGLLSTPEKRKIHEIASSQSPAESMLSTQSSPRKLNRSPLKECSANILQDTPSRKKQVTFQEPARVSASPALRRKFGSIVQDSDEEDTSWSEGDEEFDKQVDVDVSVRTFVQGSSVGEETQAVLDQIDQACAHAERDVVPGIREVSQELGEPLDRRDFPDEEEEGPQDTVGRDGRPSSHNVSRVLDQESMNVPSVSAESVRAGSASRQDFQPFDLAEVEDLPSSPIVIKDEPSDDDEHIPTPPQPSRRSLHPTPHEPSQALAEPTDLDGEPIHAPHSPSQRRPETQHSHCSKAERQPHSELTSYTQYRHRHQSSSMHVAHDQFSYQATPFPATTMRQERPLRGTMGVSQATTIDGTQLTPKNTPRKAATQVPRSANTTPRKEADASVYVSPQQPPPLSIPSSFPTPGRTRGEIWSSPTFERIISGNGASIEDFSIPPLPPLDDDIEDDF
ncbi:hypothetical protein BDV96DRAFT_573734, partial [Lophiotrema nucula]